MNILADRGSVLYSGVVVPPGEYVGGVASIFKTYEANCELFCRNGFAVSFQPNNVDSRGREFSRSTRISLIRSLFAGNYLGIRADEIGADSLIHMNSSIGVMLFKDLCVCGRLKKRYKHKIVLSIHYAELKKILSFPAPMWLWKYLFSNIDHVIFLSRETRDEFAAAGIVEKNKSSVLYTFHSLDLDNQIVRVPKNKKKILFLGMLSERKGILDLLKAFRLLDDQDVTLEICGTGSKEIEAVVEEAVHSSGGRIVWRGYVTGDEKLESLMSSGVFCLPSYGEGLPIAMLEAMACGCVPVVGPVGAIPEIISPESNGFLTRPGDEEDIARQIIEALGCSEEVRVRAVEEAVDLRIDSNINKLCDIYSSVLFGGD